MSRSLRRRSARFYPVRPRLWRRAKSSNVYSAPFEQPRAGPIGPQLPPSDSLGLGRYGCSVAGGALAAIVTPSAGSVAASNTAAPARGTAPSCNGSAGHEFAAPSPNPDTTTCPSILSVKPNFGSVAWKSPITITGTDLKGATSITFHRLAQSIAAIDVSCPTDTKCTATTPYPEAERWIGTRLQPVKTDLVVTTSAGTSSASTPADTFTFHPMSIVQLGDSVPAGEGTLEGWTFNPESKTWSGGNPGVKWPGPYPRCHDSVFAYGQTVSRRVARLTSHNLPVPEPAGQMASPPRRWTGKHGSGRRNLATGRARPI